MPQPSPHSWGEAEHCAVRVLHQALELADGSGLGGRLQERALDHPSKHLGMKRSHSRPDSVKSSIITWAAWTLTSIWASFSAPMTMLTSLSLSWLLLASTMKLLWRRVSRNSRHDTRVRHLLHRGHQPGQGEAAVPGQLGVRLLPVLAQEVWQGAEHVGAGPRSPI